MTHPAITHLQDVAGFDALLAASAAHPVLLFKHSVTCGTSAQAFDELSLYLDSTDRIGATVAMVTVQTHREVSTAIAERLRVRHETPQALLLHHGRVVWHASHFRVTADAMTAAMHAHAAAPVGGAGSTEAP